MGVEVDVLVPAAPGSSKANVLDGVRVTRVPYWFSRHQALTRSLTGIVPQIRQRPHRALLLIPMMATLVVAVARRRRTYDIIHAHWIYPAGLAAALVRHRSVAFVVTSHGSDINLAAGNRFLRRLVKWVAGRADVLTTVSEALSETASTWLEPEKIRFVPLGVEIPEQTDTRPPGAGPLRVVFVGALSELKSVGTLIEALGLVRRGRVVATIVGDGPARQDLEHLTAALDVEARFVGYLSPEQALGHVAAADALVLPSLSEGRPTVVLEAMAAGKPVLATDIPGTRELVEDGATGYLFPPQDAASLAISLERLAGDVEAARGLGAAGRRRLVDEGLTADGAARAHADLYESLVHPRSGDR
jgi:glycosyltransferase involved in cell wall biosynthesis